jgi:hypothetical protein
MLHYWQLAAGNASTGRNYSGLFLKHGLLFLGGDDPVELASEIQEGDVVILKEGLNKILAAGIVVKRGGKTGGKDDKSWIRDIDGWDLRAYTFVNWHVAPAPIQTVKKLGRATLCLAKLDEHQRIADELLKLPGLKPESEPAEPNILTYEEIVSELARQSSSVDSQATLGALRNTQRVYSEEFESAKGWNAATTRDELVKPLLASLGWLDSEIRDDIKGRGLKNVLCCFVSSGSKISVGIEYRPFYSGLDLSDEQADGVGKGLTGAQVLAITNGVALKIYARQDRGPFKTEPRAYVNLARPAERCSYDPKMPGVATSLRLLLKPN